MDRLERLYGVSETLANVGGDWFWAKVKKDPSKNDHMYDEKAKRFPISKVGRDRITTKLNRVAVRKEHDPKHGTRYHVAHPVQHFHAIMHEDKAKEHLEAIRNHEGKVHRLSPQEVDTVNKNLDKVHWDANR